MKNPLLVALVSLFFMAPQALAVDHNNIDAGRPLDFDDADSIAYREKTLEVGATLTKPKNGKAGLTGAIEYLQGIAPNTHLSLDFDPAYASEDGEKRRLDIGDVGIGLFHTLNREVGNTPAFALRADAYLPTGRDSNGLDYRLRAIASKQVRQYDRLHLNLDLNVNNAASTGQGRTRPGIILGYSRPLGYPTRFDRTLIAQIGYSANEERGQSAITNLGIGLRQQIGVRSVFDIGIKTDVSGGANRDRFALVAGYSRQF